MYSILNRPFLRLQYLNNTPIRSDIENEALYHAVITHIKRLDCFNVYMAR